MQQVLAVFAVLGLLMASLWWLRQRGIAQFSGGLKMRRTRKNLELVERLALAPQHSLHLVRYGGRSLLIGVSPAGCALLESREAAPAAVSAGEIR